MNITEFRAKRSVFGIMLQPPAHDPLTYAVRSERRENSILIAHSLRASHVFQSLSIFLALWKWPSKLFTFLLESVPF
jgi:hypothetical protein